MKTAEELFIHALGPQGDGIHRSDQGPVYVERALPGDTVRAAVRNDAGILRGEAIEMVDSSPHRVAPLCRHYDVCGGCTLQHAGDSFYRTWKIEVVRAALHKKSLSPETWREPVFLPAGGRRRVTFAAEKRNGVVTLGYFRRRSHQVSAITSCLTAAPAIMDLRDRLTASIAPILQAGKPSDIFIQAVNGRLDMVLTGPVGKGQPDLQTYEAIARLAQSSGIDRMAWRLSDRSEPEVMVEVNPVRAVFGSLEVALPPLAFLQPTQAGEEALVHAVMELLPKSGKFADLFSGCGTFSGPMLDRGPVDSYESDAAAVQALAKSKGARPLRPIRRDLFRNPLGRDELDRYDAVVFDPPRPGAQEQAKEMAASRGPLLIAVSCNPASFARDARILVDGGYRLESLGLIDQFPWSHHVELVASFRRAGV